MRSTMLKIFPVETHKDIQIAQMLFVEYAEFLKKDLSEYADLPWLIDYYRDFEKETANLPDRYRPPEGAIWLARYNNQPAGCVALGDLSDGICEMKRLFVRPKFQRKGVGAALCKALLEQAKKAGYTHMRLATALQVPRILYYSLGFKKIAPYRDIPDELKDVVFMELKLV